MGGELEQLFSQCLGNIGYVRRPAIGDVRCIADQDDSIRVDATFANADPSPWSQCATIQRDSILVELNESWIGPPVKLGDKGAEKVSKLERVQQQDRSK